MDMEDQETFNGSSASDRDASRYFYFVGAASDCSLVIAGVAMRTLAV
jgi:hypothetical protein